MIEKFLAITLSILTSDMGKPIAIIFGAGENIGAATSKAFADKGYRVALVARTINTSDTNEARLPIAADLSELGSVSAVFARVREVLGEPSLIFYNAAGVHRTDPTNPFTISEEEFAADLTVNTTSVYAAMKEAIASFQTLSRVAAKTFIYTGNLLSSPGNILPRAFSMGVGKSATAHLVHVASEAYKEVGYK